MSTGDKMHKHMQGVEAIREDKTHPGDVVAALNRLQRVGDARGKTAQKLIESARAVAAAVVSAVVRAEAVGTDLPRGYGVTTWRRAYSTVLVHALRNPRGHFFVPPGEEAPPVVQDRIDDAWLLARDVADGWIDEVADMIEEKVESERESALALERGLGGSRLVRG